MTWRPATGDRRPATGDLVAGEVVAADRVTIDPVPRRVRVLFRGTVVADSEGVQLLREPRWTPRYYFPWADVRTDLLEASSRRKLTERKGEAHYWSLVVGGQTSEDALWSFPEPVRGCPDLSGYACFDWLRVDHVFEEDDEVFVHPRDPHTRIDVFDSSRHVRVELDGVVLAESRRPRILFESTGLPRYYLPQIDVRLDLLVPSTTTTECPYKGTATYHSAVVHDRVHDDLVWTYRAPLPEAVRVAGLLCFFDEFVDTFVDGTPRGRPETKWKHNGPNASTWSPGPERPAGASGSEPGAAGVGRRSRSGGESGKPEPERPAGASGSEPGAAGAGRRSRSGGESGKPGPERPAGASGSEPGAAGAGRRSRSGGESGKPGHLR